MLSTGVGIAEETAFHVYLIENGVSVLFFAPNPDVGIGFVRHLAAPYLSARAPRCSGHRKPRSVMPFSQPLIEQSHLSKQPSFHHRPDTTARCLASGARGKQAIHVSLNLREKIPALLSYTGGRHDNVRSWSCQSLTPHSGSPE